MNINEEADASSNSVPLNFQGSFFEQLEQHIVNRFGELGDTITIESASMTPYNNRDVGTTGADNSMDPGPYGVDTMPSNEIPIQNIYSQITGLLNMAIDPSGNAPLFAPSNSPTTRQEYGGTISPPARQTDRGRRGRMMRSNMIFDEAPFRWDENETNEDVNRDYANFVSSLFNIQGRRRGVPNLESILNSSLLDPSQNIYKNVVSEDGEKDIKFLIFKEGDYPEQKSCPMTLVDFAEGNKISQLPCEHIFEEEAIMKWLRTEDARCPVCRKSLKSKEIKKESKAAAPLPSNTNRRLTTRDLLTQLIDNRVRREEDDDLQRAIMASLRDDSL